MEDKRKHTIKKVLFGLALLALFIPGIQHATHFSNEKPLEGSFQQNQRIPFKVKDWWSGDFQQAMDKHLTDHFGFRSSFIRVYNQSQFSFYGVAKANGVIIGYEDYLYELNYIRAYYGTDFVGQDSIEYRVNQLKEVQDTLKSLGKEVLVILAPGKGSYHPEFVPIQYREKSRGVTNHEIYAKALVGQGIPTIDCTNWFLKMKSTTPYPLFARGGIHWSKYGEYLAADSIIETVELLTGNDLPDLTLDSIDYQARNELGDYDIAGAMNLVFRTKTDSMAYPRFHFENIENKNNTRVLTVADSYYWGMFNYGFSEKVFNGGQFWYYHQQIFPDNGTPIFIDQMSDEEVLSEVQKNDLVMIIVTEANLYRFAFGFVDQLHRAYFPRRGVTSLRTTTISASQPAG